MVEAHDKMVTFRWRDADLLLVHEVRAKIVDGSPSDRSIQAIIDYVTTLCGIEIPVEIDSVEDDVTCTLCLEADWLGGLGQQLSAPDVTSAPETVAAPV